MATVTRTKDREQFLADVLTTAVEGGIGYWSRVYDRERADDLSWTKIQLLDFESLEDPPTGNFGFIDWVELDRIVEQGNDYSVMQHVYTVDLDAVEAAIQKIITSKAEDIHLANEYIDTIAGASRTNDAGYGAFDAITADAVVQVACFSEVIYG